MNRVVFFFLFPPPPPPLPPHHPIPMCHYFFFSFRHFVNSVVLSELKHTEQRYLKSLSVLAEGYIPRFNDQHLPTFLVGKKEALLANIDQIFHLHRYLVWLAMLGYPFFTLCGVLPFPGIFPKCLVTLDRLYWTYASASPATRQVFQPTFPSCRTSPGVLPSWQSTGERSLMSTSETCWTT